jgi:hypothetical protein
VDSPFIATLVVIGIVIFAQRRPARTLQSITLVVMALFERR